MKKLTKKYKILATSLVIVLLLVIAGVIFNKTTWLFTPAYSQKNTADKFISDISYGNTEAAYLLTTDSYKSNTSYAAFYGEVQQIEYNKMDIKNVAYLSKPTKTTISGSIDDVTIDKNMVFYINIAKDKGTYGVDSVIITSAA